MNYTGFYKPVIKKLTEYQIQKLREQIDITCLPVISIKDPAIKEYNFNTNTPLYKGDVIWHGPSKTQLDKTPLIIL